MVVGTSLAVVTIATGGTAAMAGAAIGTAAGTSGAAVGSAGAVGAVLATSGGAVAGTAAAGTAAGTAVGAIAGGSAAVGTMSTGAGLSALVAGTGPVGWILLGTAANKCHLTFDCWKPVLHDSSPEPSNGMLIRDIVRHPNIASVAIETTNNVTLPHIILENVWREKFEIQYFVIKDTGRLVAHAKLVLSENYQ